MSRPAPVRTLVVWCPDWPLVAAGVAPTVAAAVVRDDHVLACSAAARDQGVRIGLARREAQRRCPELVLITEDPDRDARAFEPVVAAVERFAATVGVIRPGICACPVRGASRYQGRYQGRNQDAGRRTGGGGHDSAGRRRDDVELARRVGAAVGNGCRVGIADGLFAAGLAARDGVVVSAGGTPRFLVPWPVEVLGRPDLADLLVRLGLRTLGEFAALPGRDVLARFGPDGARAHRLARGLDGRPLPARVPPPDLTVSAELDPPVDRVDRAAFTVKALADELHGRLAAHRLVCARIVIEAVTERGERLVRRWRHDGALTSTAVAERVRWQLDGWIRTEPDRPTSGLVLLRLAADQVSPDNGRQLDLWGTPVEDDERVARAIARVQGMLGTDGVVTAVPGGGRGPTDRVDRVAWGEPRQPTRPVDAPWPGHLPAPSPAAVHGEPRPADLTDDTGASVAVSGRHVVSAAPAWLAPQGDRRRPVAAWAGPWPVDERWWDPAVRCRLARLQVVTADGSAWLLALRGGRWWIEAEYD